VESDFDISIIPGVTGHLLDSTAYDETPLKRGPMTTQIIVDATKPVGLPRDTMKRIKLKRSDKKWAEAGMQGRAGIRPG